MFRKTMFIIFGILVLGVLLTACQDTSHRTTPAAQLGISAHDMLLTLNAPPNDWNTSIWCWYGEDNIWVNVAHPHITDSADIACSFTTESGTGTCEVEPAMHRCNCHIPQGTSTFTVTITGTSDPAPLVHTVSIPDIMPATCEDDPTGWVMGDGGCDPDGSLIMQFAYPDSYDAASCDIIDQAGTDYSCVIQPDTRFSSLCVCHGLPVLGQYLIRQITLHDGTQINAQPRFSGVDANFCNQAFIPTEATSSNTKSNPPPPTCADQTTPDACKMFGSCYWWYSNGTCSSSPEPVQPNCGTFGDEKTCNANGCKWDPNLKTPCY